MPKLIDNLFLSVGAMKAGTTWMYQVLEEHPQIYFAPEKEIHYFAHTLVKGQAPLNPMARLRRLKSHIAFDPAQDTPAEVRLRLLWGAHYLSDPIDDLWYKNIFSFRGRQKYCADFSNLYALLDADGWEHVKAAVGNLRVIYTMRNPVERLWSHCKFHLTFIGQQDRIPALTPQEMTAFIRRPMMWAHTEYAKIVNTLRAALPADNLRIYFFENIHDDQRGWLKEIEDFLGIEQFDYPDAIIHKRVNESVKAPMPAWFPGLVQDDILRISEELCSLGLRPPESWWKPHIG